MKLSQSVLATLAYHDIFDYPLTLSQIHKFLIAKKATILAVEKVVRHLVKVGEIGEIGGIYFLPKRADIVRIRRERKKYSWPKFTKAVIFAKLLKMIPTIKMVAVSGALAMENSSKNDDIDLVIVSSTNWLWTTRFLANLLLWPFKRSPRLTGQKAADRVCLNIFLDESDQAIRPQNLYSAHEICQMLLLWDRDKTYSRFIDSNEWISKFLPSWNQSDERPTTNDKRRAKNTLVISRLALVVENFARNFQLWYMRSKITTERVGETQLFFHPQNQEQRILGQYQNRLRKLNLTG